MDLLMTLIGNAAVDPDFRTRFLDNPIDTADSYGFHFTKGEFELMQTVFSNLEPQERQKLDNGFAALQDALYARLASRIGPCTHPPCLWSLCPPAAFRAARLGLEKVKELKKKTGT